MFRSFSRLLVAAMSRDHVAVPAAQTTMHALKHCSLVGRCGRGISPGGHFGFVCFTRPDTRGSGKPQLAMNECLYRYDGWSAVRLLRSPSAVIVACANQYVAIGSALRRSGALGCDKT